MATIGATAVAHQGRTTGFDYLRLGLALAVVVFHCLQVGNVYWSHILADCRPGAALILSAFFALSGYLVVGSLIRNTVTDFILLRFIRLVPALAFEITLSALLIGSYFTKLPIGEYYTNVNFWAYFLNIIGDIHYSLPGVFDRDQVNAQLWTIPFELKCYVILIGVSLLTLFPIRSLFSRALVFAAMALTAWVFYRGNGWLHWWHLSGQALVCAFLWACTIYVFKDHIPYSAPLAIAALVVAEIFLFSSRFEVFATLPIAYVTVYIGLMTLPRIRFGDLSYGIYLFHYPVLQALRFGPHIVDPLPLIGSTILISGICALVSWNLIERPILNRKAAILESINGSIERLRQTMRPAPMTAGLVMERRA